MHALLSERKRGNTESAFTLIELLVVMIIIAILMAVAVPTFLKQKQNAVKSQATQNVKQIVNAIESCGQSNTDGTYTGCNWAKLLVDEPSLSNITPAPTVTLGADNTSYTVTVATTTGASFTEQHTSAGNILHNCTATTGSAGAKACDTSKPRDKMW